MYLFSEHIFNKKWNSKARRFWNCKSFTQVRFKNNRIYHLIYNYICKDLILHILIYTTIYILLVNLEKFSLSLSLSSISFPFPPLLLFLVYLSLSMSPSPSANVWPKGCPGIMRALINFLKKSRHVKLMKIDHQKSIRSIDINRWN